MKVFYWSPHISHVATIKAVLNSAMSLNEYGNNKYDVRIINVNGEWNRLKSEKVKFIDLFDGIYIKTFPVNGFLKSRISYLYIFIKYFFSLKKLLRDEKPNFLIVHLITSLPLILLILFNFKTKFILRVSGFPKLNFIRKMLWKCASRKLYAITTPTKITSDYLKNNNIADKRKIVLLTDPVFKIRQLIKLKNQKLKDDIFLDKKNKYIVSIGRLTYQKNVSVLIKAFRYLPNNFKLKIVGDGPELEVLKQLDSDLSQRIEFSPPSNDLSVLYSSANVFCLPSRWEGFPNVIAEALSHGVPCVGFSECSGIPQLVFDGDNGFTAKKMSDPQSLAEALISASLIKSRPSEIALTIRNYTYDKYIKSWEIAFCQ